MSASGLRTDWSGSTAIKNHHPAGSSCKGFTLLFEGGRFAKLGGPVRAPSFSWLSLRCMFSPAHSIRGNLKEHLMSQQEAVKKEVGVSMQYGPASSNATFPESLPVRPTRFFPFARPAPQPRPLARICLPLGTNGALCFIVWWPQCCPRVPFPVSVANITVLSPGFGLFVTTILNVT